MTRPSPAPAPSATLDLPRARTTLDARRDELRRRLAQLADVPDGDREVSDQKDEAERVEAAELEQAQQALELAELAEVDAALARLASGRYGRCTDCGADIAAARLTANPAAARCAPCQQAHERSAPQGG